MINLKHYPENPLADDEIRLEISTDEATDLSLLIEANDESSALWRGRYEFFCEGHTELSFQQLLSRMSFSRTSFRHPLSAFTAAFFRFLHRRVSGGSDAQTKFLHFSSNDLKYRLRLYRGRRCVAESSFPLLFSRGQGGGEVLTDPVKGCFFSASMASQKPGPAVLVLGGSAGGVQWSQQVAALLSARGYHSLALSYFDFRSRGNLPKSLEAIPLEGITKALAYLSTRPEIDQKRIGLVSISKGSEAILHYLSRSHTLPAAVACYMPSAYGFEGVYLGKVKASPSWTWNGVPLAFIPYPSDSRFSPFMADGQVRCIHDRAMEMAGNELMEAAAIRLPKLKTPLLLISAGKDGTWDSAGMAEELVDKHPGAPIVHQNYPEAGHIFTVPNIPASIDAAGQKAGNLLKSHASAWRELRSFLEQQLEKHPGSDQ